MSGPFCNYQLPISNQVKSNQPTNQPTHSPRQDVLAHRLRDTAVAPNPGRTEGPESRVLGEQVRAARTRARSCCSAWIQAAGGTSTRQPKWQPRFTSSWVSSSLGRQHFFSKVSVFLSQSSSLAGSAGTLAVSRTTGTITDCAWVGCPPSCQGGSVTTGGGWQCMDWAPVTRADHVSWPVHSLEFLRQPQSGHSSVCQAAPVWVCVSHPLLLTAGPRGLVHRAPGAVFPPPWAWDKGEIAFKSFSLSTLKSHFPEA